jgi:hypothetical protein
MPAQRFPWTVLVKEAVLAVVAHRGGTWNAQSR